MKANLFSFVSDWILWLTIPAVSVAWLEIGYPIWRQFPPIALIMGCMILTVIHCMTAFCLIPKSAHPLLFAYRASQFGIGLAIALFRLIGG